MFVKGVEVLIFPVGPDGSPQSDLRVAAERWAFHPWISGAL